MAEWFKAAVLKTVRRQPRGFESLSLRQTFLGRVCRLVVIGGVLAAVSELGCGGSGPKRYGVFTGETPTASIPDLLASPELHLGEEVVVRGVVAQVCQEMGCWFEVMEGGKRLMVDLQMGRHFTVPKDVGGYTARVEGTLIRDEGVLKIIGRGVEFVPPAGG